MNINQLSPAKVKFDFKRLAIEVKAMEKLEGNPYFEAQETFKEHLREFLRHDFSVLSTQQLLTLISWESSHRAVAPHSFLITCANLIK